MSADLLNQIASDSVIDKAFLWLCKTRKEAHHNNDVWHLRFFWLQLKLQLQQTLLLGNYDFSPCRSLNVTGQSIGQWSAKDALVLKAMSLVLSEHLIPSVREECIHVSGRGGAKGCVQYLRNTVSQYRFVCRSDVNSYYASIEHQCLAERFEQLVDDPLVCELFYRMLSRVDDVNGELHEATIGINKGNPLSPLLGALYLAELDTKVGDYCNKHQLVYRRYMDDWVILCRSRNQLRTVIKIMNRALEKLKVSKHPFKTYIGKIKPDGFDFLGYRISANSLRPAWTTWENHQVKLLQLYEQGASQECIEEYVQRWLLWLRSGVEIDLSQALDGLVCRVPGGI